MAKIAVDIVILPSDEMTDKAIEANRELTQAVAGKIILNKDNCLPHISLVMGCADEKDVGKIEQILKDIAKENLPGELKANGIYIGTNDDGEKLSLYHIEKTQVLQLLHEKVMTKLSPYFTYDVTADMLLRPSEIGESTLCWIENYPHESSFEKFSPHITIGFGTASALDLPLRFTISKLALCHLGNHCTCRKILASVEPGI